MAQNQRSYDHEYKVQAVKLALEIGSARAGRELGISRNTIYGWVKAVHDGRLDIGEGAHDPQSALTLNQEMIELRKQLKAQEKEIKRLKEESTIWISKSKQSSVLKRRMNSSLKPALFSQRAVGSLQKRKAEIHSN